MKWKVNAIAEVYLKLIKEKEMATHSSFPAWRIPGTREPDGLPSMGLHRVRYDWSDLAAAAAGATEMNPCVNWAVFNQQYPYLLCKIIVGTKQDNTCKNALQALKIICKCDLLPFDS